MTFVDITHPDDLDKDINLLRKLTDGEIDTYSLEKRYIRKDGSEVWVSITVTMMCSGSGSLLFYIASIEDIAVRKAAETTLQRSKAQFRAVFEHAATGIVITDTVGALDPDGG